MTDALDPHLYSEPELAALEFSEAMTRGSGEVERALLQELRAYFSEAEIVEITLVAGLFAYFNRVNNALDVEPTAPSPFLD
jgi:alkylhydroperoxidase family enzyme